MALINQAESELIRLAEHQEAALALLEQMRKGITYTVYNQHDPQWSAQPLGNGSTTIGASGGLITSMASLLMDSGVAYTPSTLNIWLKANGGYSTGTPLVFAAIDSLHAVKFERLVECVTVPAPIADLEAWIKSGHFAVVQVNNEMPPDYHWVRYLAGSLMMDPGYGDIASITPRYLGQDAAQCILRCVFYQWMP